MSGVFPDPADSRSTTSPRSKPRFAPPASNTPNSAWRHTAFQAYADHLASEEFASGLFELLMLTWGLRTAVMCAEVLWWRCHRRMISDVLVFLGARVIHIMDAKSSQEHGLTAPARVAHGVLTYAPELLSVQLPLLQPHDSE